MSPPQESDASAEPKPPPAWRRWTLKLLPYVLTAVVVAAILYKYPLEKIVAELQKGDVLYIVPFAIVGAFVGVALVAWADRMVIAGACGRAPRYVDVFCAKAGASLLNILGYAAGHGAYGVWIGRFMGTRAWLTGGIVLYIMASDLMVVCAIATAAIYLTDVDVPAAMQIVPPIVTLVLLFFILTGPFKWLGEPPALFRPWAIIPRRVGLANAGIRVLVIVQWATVTWLAALSFGMEVPFEVMASYLPIITLVGALPINAGGFGAVQGAWLMLTDWAEGPQILAFHFLWNLAVAFAILIRGLPFVKRVAAEVARAKREDAAKNEVKTPTDDDPESSPQPPGRDTLQRDERSSPRDTGREAWAKEEDA